MKKKKNKNKIMDGVDFKEAFLDYSFKNQIPDHDHDLEMFIIISIMTS